MHRCHWNYFLQFPGLFNQTLYVSPTGQQEADGAHAQGN